MKMINMNELEMVNGGQEPMILEQTVVWYDRNGNKYTTTIKAEEVKIPDIRDKFPGLVFGSLNSFFNYASYGAAVDGPYYLQSEWLLDAFKKNHGEVLGHFYLSGDGQVIYGEPMVAQYGLKTWVDWKELMPNYSNSSYLPFVPRWDMDRYDWLCSQFASCYIDVGLRQDVNNKDDSYTEMMITNPTP